MCIAKGWEMGRIALEVPPNGAPKMSAMKFHVGDRVEDKKSHERGRVTFVYSTLELRDEFVAVLFNGHDEALAVPADSVRKVSTRQ